MKPAFWLLILFMLASGLSAWIGNEWGRLIGKRKLTVFSLRPKHTSSILTILLSIALSLGFMGVYLLVDPNTRESLLSPESGQERQFLQIQQLSSDFNATLQRIHHQNKLALQLKGVSLQSKKLSRTKLTSEIASNQLIQKYKPVNPNQIKIQPESSIQVASTKFTRPSNREVKWAKSRDFNSLPPLTQVSPLLPKTNDELLPRSRSIHLASPDEAKSQLLTHSSPTTVALLKEPIFQLRVYGGRSPIESRRIISGVLDLARAYARDLGISEKSDPIQLQQLNLEKSHLSLEKSQIYQLQVKVGKTTTSFHQLPVRLVLKPETKGSQFDPQQILEQARLNPDNNQDLRDDLSQAILALAHETRQDLQLEEFYKNSDSDIQVAVTPLSIQIMQLRRAGNTLHGQIVLLAEATNLTEN